VDFRRLGPGDVIAAAGGLILLLSLFLPWFGPEVPKENLCGRAEDSCTAFETFSFLSVSLPPIPGLDLLLPAAAAAPWILVWIMIRGHELTWPPGEVTAIVGVTATALILYNGLVDRVGVERSFVGLEFGWFIGLLGALTILAGAAFSQMTRGGAKRRPPGQFA
jgi:hypothetical protein